MRHERRALVGRGFVGRAGARGLGARGLGGRAGAGASARGASADGPRVLWWALAGVPALLAAVGALVLFSAGDTRQVQLRVALPLVVLLGGIALSAAMLAVVGMAAVRMQRVRREAGLRDEAVARGAREQRANHARFLARLDHELKNPLTAILATSAAAQNDAGAVDAWPIVDHQAAKLGGLVRDLRKLAELESRPLERERVDLEQLLAEAVAALGQQDPRAGERIVLTVTRVPWPVPPIAADPDLLSLAIDNVLGNAAKYSTAGPIEMRLREEGGQAVIEVADTGRGIPEADLPQVFDELARARNARDVAGSGIGLTLVAAILRRHGGTIALRSAEGSGTVVTLRLPLT